MSHGTKQTTGGLDCAMNPIQHTGKQEWHVKAGGMAVVVMSWALLWLHDECDKSNSQICKSYFLPFKSVFAL
jgi:hypothetical protein